MALESNSSLDAARETQMVRSISVGGETHECVMRVSEPQCSIEKKRKLGHGCCSASVQSRESKEIKCTKERELSGSGDPVGYVHVRARRGQATDKHSLAERLRREKISERMKVLQDLVPGCDKVVGKALVLDEIINYVQSLQNQVEYLSMKLDSRDLMVYNLGLNDSEGSQLLQPVQQINNIEPSCISAPFSLQGQGPLIDFYQEDESFTMEEGEHKHGFLNLIEPDNINMCSFH